LSADDNRFDIHYNLALIYTLYNFLPEGFYHCRRAIDLSDSQYQPWALNLAGNIQFEMGNYNQALDYNGKLS
jgi:tetratricopeptide (TPR) repeat protein